MSPIRSPFFRTVRSLWDTYVLRRPFYYPSEYGAERRRHDKRRAYVMPLALAWAEIRPVREHYHTDAEFEAAAWVWDDGQRALAQALKIGDRRRNPQPAFTTLLASLTPTEAGQ